MAITLGLDLRINAEVGRVLLPEGHAEPKSHPEAAQMHSGTVSLVSV